MAPEPLPMEPATAADAVALVELRDQLATWLTDRGINQWVPGGVDKQRMRAWITGGHVHVHRQGGQPVAAVAVFWEDPDVWGDRPSDDAGYIHLLMVDRKLWGRGMGDAVLSWAEHHIVATGRSLAGLDAVGTNAWLQRWYEARGYQEVGRRSFDDAPPHRDRVPREEARPGVAGSVSATRIGSRPTRERVTWTTACSA